MADDGENRSIKVAGNWTPIPSEDVFLRHNPPGPGILLSGNDIFITNDTGVAIWQQINGTTTVEDIVQHMVANVDAAATTISDGVHAFLRTLADRGLIG